MRAGHARRDPVHSVHSSRRAGRKPALLEQCAGERAGCSGAGSQAVPAAAGVPTLCENVTRIGDAARVRHLGNADE